MSRAVMADGQVNCRAVASIYQIDLFIELRRNI